MRRARFKTSVRVAHYHCFYRVVDRNFVLGELEKQTFEKRKRRSDTYRGVRFFSYCVMTAHFHILLEFPKRPTLENFPKDQRFVDRLRLDECSCAAGTLARELAAQRHASRVTETEALREQFFVYVSDASFFCLVKCEFPSTPF